jgi:hypothetical protein
VLGDLEPAPLALTHRLVAITHLSGAIQACRASSRFRLTFLCALNGQWQPQKAGFRVVDVESDKPANRIAEIRYESSHKNWRGNSRMGVYRSTKSLAMAIPQMTCLGSLAGF